MKIAIILALVGIVLAAPNPESEIQDQRTFGILGDLFGNTNQCRNCRYNLSEANYCCNTGRDRSCCRYSNSNVGGSSYDPGQVGGSSYNPGYSNGYNNNKPGTCPNSYGRKRRSPQNILPPGFSGSSYKPNYNGGYNNGGYNNGGLNWSGNTNNQGSSCYSDRDCPGSEKCCSQYGRRRCVYPNNYYG